MQHRTGEVEGLPPLELRPIRTLALAEGEEARHVSAASGVARRGDFVYVVGDDLLHLGESRLSSPEPGRLRQALRGQDLAPVYRRLGARWTR